LDKPAGQDRPAEAKPDVSLAKPRVRALIVLLTAISVLALSGNALARTKRHKPKQGHNVPALLSQNRGRPSVASAYGSGDFGRWLVDQWGLPAYHYTADEMTDADAKQPDVGSSTAGESQVGNDNIKGMAFNDGYTELWSQQLLPEWGNLYQPSDQHYAGGYGYLDVGGHTASTLYLDHPQGESFQRYFGVGYYRKQISFGGLRVRQDTYAPFGSDPVLLDDVTITNNSSRTKHAAWFEYWDVNPYEQGLHQNQGLLTPTWNSHTETLAVRQLPDDARDTQPLSSFAAVLRGPRPGWETSLTSFFGRGTRAVPAEVGADRLSQSLATPDPVGVSGKTLFVFRSPVTVRPHHSVTLRYIYGMAHGTQVPGLVARYRAAARPERASEREWVSYLPRVNFGSGYKWVSREIEWDGYLLRSATVYEEKSGEHTITQGGDYQYGLGANLGTRSWLHYSLPMSFSDPELTKQILLYATKLQPPGSPADAQLPYGTGALFERLDIGTSNDLDFWLLNAAAQYGLATRDLSFFHQQVPFYATGQTATEWQHLKIAFEHTQTYLSLFGDYLMGSTGDWNDFSTEFEHMNESTLILAQLTYAYPQLAQLADRYGDPGFAAQLRKAGTQDLKSLRAQWVPRGWYSRGYSGVLQVGKGVIFEEPQPWAILAGAPSSAQARQLVGNIHRYLDGYGAPGGPTKIGTAQVPGVNDPGVTEHAIPPLSSAFQSPSTAQGADEWPGGVWYDLNGWLTWAYGTLQGEVPGAVQDAWSEYLRNTLADHATAFPHSWDGVVNVDDVCDAYFSETPQDCGNDLDTSFGGQITEQPTWMEMDPIDLAGVTPTASGYRITPHLPMTSFSLRFPEVGVARAPSLLRGYVRPSATGPVSMQVSLPPDSAGKTLQAYVGRKAVTSTVRGGLVTFTLPAQAGQAADWAVKAVERR
jgi:hypothetical protein